MKNNLQIQIKKINSKFNSLFKKTIEFELKLG